MTKLFSVVQPLSAGRFPPECSGPRGCLGENMTWRDRNLCEVAHIVFALVPGQDEFSGRGDVRRRVGDAMLTLLQSAYLVASSPDEEVVTAASATIDAVTSALERARDLDTVVSMALIEEIASAAYADASDGRRLAGFRREWPDHHRRLDKGKVAVAIQAWRTRERLGGRRNKWTPVREALESMGIEIQSERALSTAWSAHRAKRATQPTYKLDPIPLTPTERAARPPRFWRQRRTDDT